MNDFSLVQKYPMNPYNIVLHEDESLGAAASKMYRTLEFEGGPIVLKNIP